MVLLNVGLIIMSALVIAGLIILISKLRLINRMVSAIQGIIGLSATHPIAACGIALLFIAGVIMNDPSFWSVL
ncbi:MAG: hypothetical protein M0P07_04815 [Candidatus Methanomethylophilaceae archaeon]|nr:hypothetical protein [Candidatus Methanomethylophilaceae archaeon]